MQKKDTSSRLIEYIPYAIFILLSFILLLRVSMIEGTDDTAYNVYIQENGILKWVLERILHWQPRIVADFLFAFFLNHINLWRILTALLQGVLIIIVERIVCLKTDRKNMILIRIIICSLYFLIYPYSIFSSVLWYTGSFYYLYMITALIIAMIPFYFLCIEKHITYKINYGAIYAAAVISCYTEQTLAVVFCFATVCILFSLVCKIKIPKQVIITFLVILINGTIFLFLLPLGERASQEIRWYPSFDSLSLLDKIFQGVNWTNYYYVNSINLIMFILVLLIFFLAIVKKEKVLTLFAGIPVFYFGFNLLPWDSFFQKINLNNIRVLEHTKERVPYSIQDILAENIYDTTKVNPSNPLGNIYDFIPSILGIAVLLFIAVLLWNVFDSVGDRFLMTVIYLAALASGYVIGLSPTIFASGTRVFYLGSIFMILIICRLLSRLSELRKTNFCKLAIILAIISIAAYSQLLFKIVSERYIL